GVGSFESRIISAENGSLIAQQFFAKTRRSHSQVGFFDVLRGQSGVPSKLGCHCVPLGLREIVSFSERFRVRSARERAPFIEERFLILPGVRDFLEMPRDGGKRRKVADE